MYDLFNAQYANSMRMNIVQIHDVENVPGCG